MQSSNTRNGTWRSIIVVMHINAPTKIAFGKSFNVRVGRSFNCCLWVSYHWNIFLKYESAGKQTFYLFPSLPQEGTYIAVKTTWSEHFSTFYFKRGGRGVFLKFKVDSKWRDVHCIIISSSTDMEHCEKYLIRLPTFTFQIQNEEIA